jgi:hypothetical protein
LDSQTQAWLWQSEAWICQTEAWISEIKVWISQTQAWIWQSEAWISEMEVWISQTQAWIWQTEAWIFQIEASISEIDAWRRFRRTPLKCCRSGQDPTAIQVTMAGHSMAYRTAMIRALIVLGFVLHGWARATAQSSEVLTEARVFQVDRNRLKDFGITPRAVSAERLESDFIINVPESSARALISGPGSKLLQSFQLRTIGETPAEFRVASRVASSQSSAESQRLEVGFDFRLLTRVSLKREIAITLISQVKIRNIESEAAESASPISGEAIRHEITTAEGASVAAGGFITEGDTRQLSRIGTLHESPVLSYLFAYGNEDQPELIVVLTPHLVKFFDVPASVSVPSVSRPAVQNTLKPAATPQVETARYTVQVGAFITEAKARGFAAELNRKYPDVFVHTLETLAKGHPRYRVRIGHFPTAQAAKELENQLRRDGLQTLVAIVN